MKYIRKINIIIIILLIIGLFFSNYSQASEISDIFSDADDFLNEGDSVNSKINTGQLMFTSRFMYKLLTAIGIVVMFIVGTILGIQFMIASAEDKAKVKEALVPYVVGCFVIFGAFSIWKIAINVGSGIQNPDVASIEKEKMNKVRFMESCELASAFEQIKLTDGPSELIDFVEVLRTEIIPEHPSCDFYVEYYWNDKFVSEPFSLFILRDQIPHSEEVRPSNFDNLVERMKKGGIW